MSTGIDPIDSAPLIIRTYNDDSADNTFLLTRYDYPVSSNYVLRTSANGELAPSDAITQTTMGMSSMTISNHFGSTMIYDTFSSGTLFLPLGIYDTIVKTTMTASSVTASTIFLNVLNICTMNASTFSPNGVTVAYTTLGSTVQTSSTTYSTLIGDSLFTNAGFVSTLFGSSIYAKSAVTAAMASDTSRLSTLTMASTSVGFLSFSTLQSNTLDVSTLSGSSIYTNSLTVSTLNGGSLIMSTISCTTLSVSSLYASGLIFSTTTGSSVVMSTATAPLLFSQSLSFSTAQGSTVTVSSVTVSSLYTSLLVGSTIQSNIFMTSTLTASSIHISELLYSTAQGSTMFVSTIGVSTLIIGAFSYSTLSGSLITSNTIMTSTLSGSTVSWNRVILSSFQGSSIMVSSVTVSTILGNAISAASLQGSTVLVSTVIGSNLNTTFFSASTIVSDSLFFSTLSISTLIDGSAVFSTLQASTATFSSLTASTLSVSTTMVSTLNGSSLVGSTLTTSGIQSDGIVFSTIHGSTLLQSTLTSCTINAQTISVSTLQGIMTSVSTLVGSTIVSGQLAYSTLIGSTIITDYITATSTCTGNGTLLLSTVSFSTQQTSNAFLSTLIITSTLTVSTLHRINPTSFTASTLSSRLQANTATGLLTCSSLTVNEMSLLRSIVNQPVYGNTVKMDSVVVSGQSLIRTSDIRATIDQMPSLPQTYTFGAAIPNRWIVGGNGIYPMMYSSDGIQWSGVGSDIFSTCYGIAWNGAMWVAVGITGAGAPNTIAYSYDGIRWTGIGMDIFIYGGTGISSNGTMWIATGYGRNSMAYSYDGINWVGLGESVFSGSGGIAWNGTMWVALGDGANSIAYSYDGIIWTGLGKSIFTNAGSGITWNGTIWVALGDGLNSIAYSYNGIIWIGLGTSIFTIRGHAIAWNGTIWVAVGWGTNSIAYSYNGINWIGLGTSVFSNRGNGIAWNGNMWIAVGGTNSIVYSYNGILWTSLVTGAFLSGQTVKYNGRRLNAITFPTPITVATGSGTNTLAYSSDGVNWTGNGLGIFSTQGNGTATNGSMWVATGLGTNTLAYSTTDIETPYIYLPFENGLYADVMGNSTITAMGSPAFVTGPIGSKAVNLANTAGSSTGSQYLNGNCTLGNNFSVSLWFKFNTLPAADSTISSIITLGSSTAMSFQIIYLTLAGHTGFYVQYIQPGNVAASIVGRISISTGIWYQCTAIFQGAGMCSVYLNNMFVGSNPGGGLHIPITNLRIGYNLAGGVSAFDGQVDDIRIYNYAIAANPRITWRGLGTSIFSTQGKGVAWNGNMWVAVGSGTNSIAYSYDGVTWIGLGVLVLTQGNAVAWSGSMWVAVGSGTNSIAYSYDGITWTGSSFSNTQWNGVAWNGSMWIAVGSGPHIMAYSYNGINWISLSSVFVPSAYLPLENSFADTFGSLTSPTMVGSVTYSTSIRKVGTYSAYFANSPGSDIATNYLTYATPSSFYNPTAITVSFWMYPTAYASSALYKSSVVIDFNNGSYSGLIFTLDGDGMRTLNVTFTSTTDPNRRAAVISNDAIPLNTWTHVVFTFLIVNGGGITTLYINGIAQTINNTTGGIGGLGTFMNPPSEMTRFTIGCRDSSSPELASCYTGYVDDVRIYTTALTPAFITLLYNSPSQVYLSETSPPFTTSGNGVAWNGDRWVAVGSGGNTILYSKNGLTWLVAASSCFTTAGNGVSWNGTRWVATGVGTIGIGYSSDGSTWTGGIVQDRTNTISPQLTGLAAHHWIQNGVAWRASASTEYLGVHYAYSAFTNNSSSVNTWGSALIYNATSGAYTGSVSTTIQGIGAVLGEWIQLQSSNPLILQSYTYACWGIATLPKEYYIVGSNDGSVWHPLQYVFMTINPCNATFTACSTYIQMNYTGTQTIIGNLAGSGMTTAYSSTTAAYTYFRIIVRSLWPSNTGVAEYNELYFRFGSPFTFNIFDPSRYYYHYTLYNGATVTPSAIKPNTPSITLASASSQYLQTANFTPTTAGLTFAFWYKSNASGSWARIFDFGNGPANNVIFCSINGGGSNYLYFEDFYGSVPTNVTLSDISYNDNTWRHVVWTLSHAVAGSNTSTWNIYINGILKTTGTAKSYPNTAVSRTISYIGRSNWSADAYYNGNIDDFRIYNSVLTASHVNTIYSGSVYDSTYNTTFSTAGLGIASNTSLSGTVMIQHPVIAVGQGTHSLAYSPDGIQWTGLGTSMFSTGYCVAWNGSKWIAGGLGAHTLAYSYDGLRWTGLGTTVFSIQTNGIAWNGSLWVAGGTGLNTVAYSTDGLTWTNSVQGTAIFTSCNAVAWNGKQWVAVGIPREGAKSIAYSADGIAWTAMSSIDVFTQGNGICWTGSLWIAVGAGINTIAYSLDGSNWIGLGATIFSVSGNGICWNGTRWVAVGTGSTHTIAYSTNGTTWIGFGKTIFPTNGNSVCWTGSRFVAVGNGSTIGYSQDGIVWYTTVNSIFSTQGNGVAGNSRLGATVSDSQVALSDSLDVVSDTYYNTGSTNFSAAIQSRTYPT